MHKLSCPRKTCTVKVPQNAQRSDIVIYNFRNLVKLLLTLLVELPDDRLGEVVGLDDVASTRDPNHLSIRGLGAGPTLLQDFRFVTLLLDLDYCSISIRHFFRLHAQSQRQPQFTTPRSCGLRNGRTDHGQVHDARLQLHPPRPP